MLHVWVSVSVSVCLLYFAIPFWLADVCLFFTLCLSVCMCVCLSVCVSVCLSVCVCECGMIQPPSFLISSPLVSSRLVSSLLSLLLRHAINL